MQEKVEIRTKEEVLRDNIDFLKKCIKDIYERLNRLEDENK